MNTKKMNVTPLERSALANLKGGAADARNWCNNSISCTGAGQSIKDQLALQKKGTANATR